MALLAAENALVHGADIKFIKADVLDSDSLKEVMKKIAPASGGIDIVVSNPPYIEKKDSSAMDANVLDFEPHQALFAPDKPPLIFYKAIAGIALKIMKPGGKLYFEMNEKYGSELSRMLEAKGFCNCEVKKDIHEKNRMLRCNKQ